MWPSINKGKEKRGAFKSPRFYERSSLSKKDKRKSNIDESFEKKGLLEPRSLECEKGKGSWQVGRRGRNQGRIHGATEDRFKRNAGNSEFHPIVSKMRRGGGACRRMYCSSEKGGGQVPYMST